MEQDELPPPPLGLADAEQLVLRLAPALHEHVQWVQQVHTTLVCRTAADTIIDDSNLQLGRWFADERSEHICNHPDYIAAKNEYLTAHTEAKALCSTALRNGNVRPEDYTAFSASLARLDCSLESLVRELWELLRFTDPLTGIATRFAMMPRLRAEHQRAQRTGVSCSICMVDLDHFKTINDTHGHGAGDRVLAIASAHLVRNLRRYDQVCRYGGEEFVIMLPSTRPMQAVPIVDRLRQSLAALPIPLDSGIHVHVTASFGIAPLVPDQPVQATIEMADRAMYAAKRAGRNRVEVTSEASLTFGS